MEAKLEALFVDLYRHQFIQTIWNAEREQDKKGWILKSGLPVPWFFNMRPIGDAPLMFRTICKLMAEMILGHDINLMVGVEMAGVPLVGGICVELLSLEEVAKRFAYTRPLPDKVRDPRDLAKYVSNYGQKNLVEGRIYQGDRCAIVDDMATDLGSKIIARRLVLFEAENRGVEAECNHIFYFLDRGANNRQRGLDFANEPNQELKPAPLRVDFVISFNEYLPCLKNVMTDNEFQAIMEHQKDPNRFGKDEEWRQMLIETARAESRKRDV